jgi:Brp/Blh family beta-carotene 15,15'-monooxygenase
VAPAFAVFGFLLLTIYHWGQADLAFEQLFRPFLWTKISAPSRGIFALFRGFIPIGLPFVAFPQEANAFLETCHALFSSAPLPGLAILRTALLLLIGLLGLLHVLTHLLAFRHSRRIHHLHVLMESAALAAFFATVPPLIAIGWYFCGWHSWRHVLRLVTYEPPRPDPQPRMRPRFGRFFWQATPFTVAALGLIAALILLVGSFAEPDLNWVAICLVAVSAFTVPHACVVAWMDRRELSHVR